MPTNLPSRVAALEARQNNRRQAPDPFAHLNDDELETFVTILDENHNGDRVAAVGMWDACSEELQVKFARVIRLHRSEGLH